jgi:PAS domain S-box-containing protein
MSMGLESEFWEKIVENIPQIVLILNEQDQLVFANKSARTLLGYEQSDNDNLRFSTFVISTTEIVGEESKTEKQYQIGLKGKDGIDHKLLFSSKFIDGQSEKFNCLVQTGIAIPSSPEAEGYDHYKQIVDAIPDLLFVIDHEFRITHFYSPGTELLVLPPLSFIGKKVTEALPPNVSAIVLESLHEALLDGKAQDRNYSLTFGPEEHWFQLTVNCYKSDNKPGFVALVREITQLRINELALIESESRYRTLAENANAAIGITDCDEYLVFVNQTFSRMLGYSHEELLGKSLAVFSPSEVFESFQEKTSSRMPGVSETYETILIHKNGERKVFSVSASPLFSSDNEYIGTIGVLIDITLQKQATENLRETSARLQAVLSSMPDLLFILDREGNYLDFFVNKQLFPNIDNKVLENAKLQDVFDETQVDYVLSAIHECLAKRQTQIINYQLKNKEKDKIEHYEAQISAMDADKVLIVARNTTNLVALESDLIIHHDQLNESKIILEKQNLQLLQLNELLRKQNEEIISKNTELALATEKAEASSRLKTAFLNNISHEVRTPLNGIVGFAQFIADEEMPAADKQEYIEAMNMSVSRLMNTMSDILDVSLLMTGNMQVQFDKFLMNELIEEVYQKYEAAAKEKGIDFKCLLPESQTITVINDRVFVLKIITEIVDNAIKYTNSGYVKYGYKLSGNDIDIFVEDTGIGISDETLPEIYEPFTQQDSSNTRSFEGSGLGLTLVRGLVDLLDGTIHIQTKKDNGTKFVISIPHHQPSIQIRNTITPVQEVSEGKSYKPVILLAEDEELNILYSKQIFKNRNFKLEFAKNGLEAIEMAKKLPDIELILMDIKMPVMDGLEATKLIKQFRPDLPIVAVTAYAGTEHHKLCIDAGCTDYVSKPFEPVELFELINRLIATSR